MQISAIMSVRGNEVKPLQLEASVDGPPLPSPRSVPLTNTDTHTGTNTPLYHSAIFPAPSCFSECTLTDIKTLMHTHEKKKQLFSDLFSMYKSQIVREMVSLGALGSHTSRPAKQENANGGFYLSFLRWSLCVCRYFHFICTHTHYESHWEQTNGYSTAEVLSVGDSLAFIWITWQPIWIAQGHSFLRRDLAIQIPTQCCNSFSSGSEEACQSQNGIIKRAPGQKIMLYRQNVKIWKRPAWLLFQPEQTCSWKGAKAPNVFMFVCFSGFYSAVMCSLFLSTFN